MECLLGPGQEEETLFPGKEKQTRPNVGDNWKDARLGDLGTSPRTLGSWDSSVLRPGLSHLYLVTECQAIALTAGP